MGMRMFRWLRRLGVGKVNLAVGGEPLFQFILDCLVCSNREKSPWDLFRKPLFPVVRVIDRHAQHSLMQTLVLLLGVGLDHENCPPLEASSCKSRSIRSFIKLFLDKMMLRFHFPKKSGYRRSPIIEDV